MAAKRDMLSVLHLWWNEGVGAIYGNGHQVHTDSRHMFMAGENNESTGGNHQVIGGGHDNTVNDLCAAVLSGRNNQAESECSVIGGGESNFCQGDAAAILSGHSNLNICPANFSRGVICGGSGNKNRGANDSDRNGASCIGIVSGDGNLIEQTAQGKDSSKSFIGAGLSNTIRNALRSVLAGGASNLVGSTAGIQDAVCAGGNGNTVTASNAVVGGGVGNDATASLATIAGGQNGTASGICATVGGGNGNTASGTSSTVAGGEACQATGQVGSVGGGDGCIASGSYGATVAGGRANIASGRYSTVTGGALGLATREMQETFGGGWFSFPTAGQAQASRLMLVAVSTGGSVVELGSAENSDRMTLEERKAYDIQIRVIATRHAVNEAGTKRAKSLREVLAHRATGAAATILAGSGSAAFTTDPETTGWLLNVDATGSPERVRIRFDPNGDTAAIRVVCLVNFTEVGKADS